MNVFLIIFFILFFIYSMWIVRTVVKYWRLPVVDIQQPQHQFTYCIVIPARNEAHNIVPLLESIRVSIQQARAEVIVIDDHSTDETHAVCAQYFDKHHIGQVLRLKDFVPEGQQLNSYKKLALEVAITHTTADWIIQTDADCIVGEQWMTMIESQVESSKVSYFTGPVRMISRDQSAGMYLFWAFQALDFMTMQGITMAGFHNSRGQMSNGANLGYRRDLFLQINGFDRIREAASGDDMLLLDKIKVETTAETAFLKKSSAIVDTEIVYTVKDLWHQRIRWGSKSKYYKDKSLTLQLGLVYVVNLMIFTLPFLAIMDLSFLKIWFLVLILKTFVEYLLVIPMAKFYQQERFLPLFPILQPFHITYVVLVGFLSLIGQYQWKNRQVK